MKKIEAIIKPFKLDEVWEALQEIGIKGMTMTEVKGFSETGHGRKVYKASAYVVDFVPKVMIMVIVKDDMLADALQVIAAAAHNGRVSDGKIFVSPIEDAVCIRTGERGENVI